MGLVRSVACVVACGTSVAVAAPAREIAVADLGWPSSTVAATVKRRIEALETAGHGESIASIATGTRVTWRAIVASNDACKAWFQLQPRGWVCAADLAPAADAPAPPAAKGGKSNVVDVRGATDAFADLAAIRAMKPNKRVDDGTRVTLGGSTIGVNGVNYALTDVGWIPADKLAWKFEASEWRGIPMATPLPFDMGWAVARVPGQKVAVRDAAAKTGKLVRELSPRDMVTITAERDGFVEVGPNEWADTVEIKKAKRVAPPDGIKPKEHWLDVDIDNQTLVAYEGDTPVFVTLVSTGRFDYWGTPTGIYRVVSKEPSAHMQDPGGLREKWDVSNVPYVMFWRRNFALHGTYWHDGFGRNRSHGCVNLSTIDAKWIYEFVMPVAPVGWSSVRTADNDGTPVRIHASWDPSPSWRDYNGFTYSKEQLAAIAAGKPIPYRAAPRPAPPPPAPPADGAAPTPAPAAPTASIAPAPTATASSAPKPKLYVNGLPEPPDAKP